MSNDGGYVPKSPDLSTLYADVDPAPPLPSPSHISGGDGGGGAAAFSSSGPTTRHHLEHLHPHAQALFPQQGRALHHPQSHLLGQHQHQPQQQQQRTSYPAPSSHPQQQGLYGQSFSSQQASGYYHTQPGLDPLPQESYSGSPLSYPHSQPRHQEQPLSQYYNTAPGPGAGAGATSTLSTSHQPPPASYETISEQPQGYYQPYTTQPYTHGQTHQAPSNPSSIGDTSRSGSSTMPPKRSAASASSAAAAGPSTVIAPSPVKTKFPTARIKRIMQADEEVGKVAQQTPIAVGKALELFMVALVTKSAEIAKEKNSRRVTPQMLKQVVETDDQWDFLREIVGKVENEEKPSKGSRVKAESDSDNEAGPGKRKGKGGRRKKVQ